jgi:hypothetical protein
VTVIGTETEALAGIVTDPIVPPLPGRVGVAEPPGPAVPVAVGVLREPRLSSSSSSRSLRLVGSADGVLVVVPVVVGVVVPVAVEPTCIKNTLLAPPLEASATLVPDGLAVMLGVAVMPGVTVALGVAVTVAV